MSKLIKNEEQDTEGYAPVLLPLSNSAVISHLKTCQQIAADSAQASFSKYVDSLDEALLDEIRDAKSNQDAVELMEVQRMLRSKRDDIERYYCGYLSEGFVKFKKQELNTSVGSDEDAVLGNKLSLLENEDLEEAIAITSLTQRADAYFAEPLWALNQRFAVLNDGEHVTESTNPASPIQLCESLRKALKLVCLDGKAKTLAYKMYDKQLLGLTRGILEEINQYLKTQGILPHLRYTIPTGAAPASYLSDEDDDYQDEQGAPLENDELAHVEMPPTDEGLSAGEYQDELLHAIRNLQNQLLVAEPAPVNYDPPATTVTEADLIEALQIIQHQPQATPTLVPSSETVAPVDVSDMMEQLKEIIKNDDADSDVEKGDMQTIDLVGMLFEYMLNDENLPDCVKALLSYLHTPFLKIAFIDPGFFEKTDHPARLLLNSLAEAGAHWVGNDGTQQYDIYKKIKNIVDRILKEFDNDVKIITTLLLEFNGYTKNIIRRQDLMEKRATEKAQGEEKLREVKLRVNDEIRKRTHNRELPSALLLFLLQPWSDYLSFALLRYGDHSEKWTKALALVDDVLWSIRPKTKDEDKAKQIGMHEDITASMKAGFDTIGFDQAKGKKLIDAVLSLMNLAMQSKKAEPAPAPMRHKLEQIAAEKAGTKSLNDDAATPEEAQVVEKLKVIEFGTWFEFDGGRRLKIAWYNARTSHYMLVDQMGKRVDMMSGLDMARQMISGTAKIISGSSKPFFERALENIFQKLNEKAEASKSAGDENATE